MNIDLLKQKISDAGFTPGSVSGELGIDPSTYYRKLQGQGDAFTVAQARKLVEILGLSGEEAVDVFFTTTRVSAG